MTLTTPTPTRLHLGCGRTILPGWINVDSFPLEGVDIVADLDNCDSKPLSIESNSVGEILGSHLLEHIVRPLPLMQELYRVATPGCKAKFHTPYGSSDDAFEDPTHVRQYFIGSFGYFSQPYYWRADYGYRGDWQPERLVLKINGSRVSDRSHQAVYQAVMRERNVVTEMIAELVAIKPAREPKRELQKRPQLQFVFVD
jgi:hypothetical protein